MNDFGFPLKAPNHPLYLNTEFVGHTYPTKTTDDDERQREHTLRHARIHDQPASNPQYAGGIGWCAFDYNTHSNFGAGDRICYHGVTDIFREPKAAAGFYKSQCDPAVEVVLEPAFHWAGSDEATGFRRLVVCTNCDHLKFFLREHSLASNPWVPVAELDPDRSEFPHLQYPPFQIDYSALKSPQLSFGWGDLRIDGYIDGKQVISRSMSGNGTNSRFALLPDDTSLLADGADTTRVVLRVTDEFDNIRPYAADSIVLTLEGPGELIGITLSRWSAAPALSGCVPPGSPAPCGSPANTCGSAHKPLSSPSPPSRPRAPETTRRDDRAHASVGFRYAGTLALRVQQARPSRRTRALHRSR